MSLVLVVAALFQQSVKGSCPFLCGQLLDGYAVQIDETGSDDPIHFFDPPTFLNEEGHAENYRQKIYTPSPDNDNVAECESVDVQEYDYMMTYCAFYPQLTSLTSSSNKINDPVSHTLCKECEPEPSM